MIARKLHYRTPDFIQRTALCVIILKLLVVHSTRIKEACRLSPSKLSACYILHDLLGVLNQVERSTIDPPVKPAWGNLGGNRGAVIYYVHVHSAYLRTCVPRFILILCH